MDVGGVACVCVQNPVPAQQSVDGLHSADHLLVGESHVRVEDGMEGSCVVVWLLGGGEWHWVGRAWLAWYCWFVGCRTMYLCTNKLTGSFPMGMEAMTSLK